MTRLIDSPAISRIRRNHGLEHATIHLLSRAKPRRPLAGHSDTNGFWLIGDVETEELAQAAAEALNRMRSGERELAVHPNCGTNFATYGTFAGIGAFFAFAGAGGRFRQKLERLPLAALFATLALILAQPFAFRLQREVTTSGDPQGLTIVKIDRTNIGRRTAHRVLTEG
jgi:hypothetical protein